MKVFLNSARKNKCILLSATPGDTWSDYIPVFVANGFYKNKSEFIREHVVYSRFTKYPKIERYLNTGKLIWYRNDILVNMNFDRPTTAHHEDVYVNYNIQMYKEVGRTRWDPYKDEPIPNASRLCYIWRKIVNSDESRQVALLEIFETHPKMIVFYNFDYELDILKGLYYGEKVDTNTSPFQSQKAGCILFSTLQVPKDGTVSKPILSSFIPRTIPTKSWNSQLEESTDLTHLSQTYITTTSSLEVVLTLLSLELLEKRETSTRAGM